MPDVAVAADDHATIMYTSGSTGHPKGALSSHRGILSALFSWMLLGLASQQVERAGEGVIVILREQESSRDLMESVEGLARKTDDLQQRRAGDAVLRTYGIGAQIGLLWKPVDELSIGLTYVSPQATKFDNVVGYADPATVVAIGDSTSAGWWPISGNGKLVGSMWLGLLHGVLNRPEERPARFFSPRERTCESP